MTARTRLSLFDTTLRDGQQTQGVDFSADDKRRIATALDRLGIDYIEGGWPGANPTDTEFFGAPPPLSRARLTAFGMTARAGISASNDPVLAQVLGGGTKSVCLVGKTHDFHVTTALGVTLEDNLDAISRSIAHLVAEGREALFDAEHFFDGYKANPTYALDCAAAAAEAGARWVVLCDTNGGTLPGEIYDIVSAVLERVPGDRVGIHTHDDCGLAVANSLAAVDAGARQIQGTLNGLGERCGNADLVTLIPTLALKEPYRSRFEIGVDAQALTTISRVSRLLDDILNKTPRTQAPYVGASAFAHKAGLHASAIVKDPTTYEHVAPEAVGNERRIPMSDQAGRSNLLNRLGSLGVEVAKDDPRVAQLLDLVKARETEGYAYDSAEASFSLLALDYLGALPSYFEIERFRVTVERRYNARRELTTVSDAFAAVEVQGRRAVSAEEGAVPGSTTDRGPVDTLYRAIVKDLGAYQTWIEDLKLVDYKVRILSAGTEAVTRVLIESRDGEGRSWSTVGVSANIVDASFQALCDAISFKLWRDGAPIPSAGG